MYVTKASGEKEEFDIDKVRKTCLRAGASEKLASKIVEEVEKKIYEGITTKNPSPHPQAAQRRTGGRNEI